MELHTAILLVNYQVEWSTTAATFDEMDAAIVDFAISEYRAEPDNFSGIPDVPEAEAVALIRADRSLVLDDLGVMITLAHTAPGLPA